MCPWKRSRGVALVIFCSLYWASVGTIWDDVIVSLFLIFDPLIGVVLSVKKVSFNCLVPRHHYSIFLFFSVYCLS